MKTLWIRGESNPNERRAPLTPVDAVSLVSRGYEVHVETSQGRVFSDDEYRLSGCIIEPKDSWRQQNRDAVTLGIKIPELKDDALYGEHVFFAHQYTRSRILHEKPTAYRMLDAFARGRGIHYDVEFMTDENGLCITAFSTIAGFIGSALGIFLWGQIDAHIEERLPLFEPSSTLGTLSGNAQKVLLHNRKPSIALIGARGHCGSGARTLLDQLDLTYTKVSRYDIGQLDIDKVLSRHEIVINCMAVDESTPKFFNQSSDWKVSNTTVISDIGCETNDNNPIIIRNRLSTLIDPSYEVVLDGHAISIIAIDHLPSITPRESSNLFSRQMLPHLSLLLDGSGEMTCWRNARGVFEEAMSGAAVHA